MGLPNGRGLASLVDRVIPGPGSMLDNASRRVQGSINRIQDRRAGRVLVQALRGNDWLGHPAHPLVTAVPIGAWVVGAAFDVRSLPGARPADEHAADTSLRLGVVGAVLAAVLGLAQYLDTSGAARRETVVHAALNNVALMLNMMSLAARASGRRRAGRRLSGIALAVVTVSGFLGGDLAYRHGVGATRATQDVEPLDTRPAPDGAGSGHGQGDGPAVTGDGKSKFEQQISPNRTQ